MKTKPPFTILIVDDEAAGRGIIQKLLPDIIGIPFTATEARNVSEALDILTRQKVDLLFLDVQMPEQSGFDLLKQLPLINFETIFVTGYDKYAIHAFRFNALDYLLKPVDIGELTNAVNKAIAKMELKEKNKTNIAALLAEKKVAVHVNDKVVFVEAANISYITAIDNYSEITTCNQKKFITPRVLKEFEFYFEQFPFFIRISRSIMLNAHCIKSYSKDFPCIIEMKTGESFETSRRKKAEVLKQLETL